MKAILKTAVYISFLFIALQISAQATDQSRISVKAIVVDDNIPTEAELNLETKLQQALTTNGLGDNGYIERFVLTAKVNIISKDITPTTPPRISEKMEITFMVGDVRENKVYDSYTMTCSGIGTNETKAFISAFQKVKPQDKNLQAMLDNAKQKIVDYYTNGCRQIIQKAKTLAGFQKEDEAIAYLFSVPNINNECFSLCQSEAQSIYSKKITDEATVLLNQAKSLWVATQNIENAINVVAILNKINPQAKNYNEAERLRQAIANKVSETYAKQEAEKQKQWDFQMKQYEDNLKLKQENIKASRDIAVAYYRNQPKTYYKTIIYGW